MGLQKYNIKYIKHKNMKTKSLKPTFMSKCYS